MMPWCQTSLHKQGSLYYSENAHVKECKCGLKGSTVEIKASKLRTYRMPYYLVIWDLKIEKKKPHTPVIFFLFTSYMYFKLIFILKQSIATKHYLMVKTWILHLKNKESRVLHFKFPGTKIHPFANFLHCYVIFAYKL